jgi:hypothetical protein
MIAAIQPISASGISILPVIVGGYYHNAPPIRWYKRVCVAHEPRAHAHPPAMAAGLLVTAGG